MSPSSGRVVVTDARGVRTVRLDRPEARNALNRAMRTELCQLLAAADQDPDVRSLIITGTDPAFTGGVDFKETDPSFDAYSAQFAANPGKALRAMTTPVICAVNGPCISGGLELGLSASFMVASDRAVFADTHARLNAVPTWGLTALLPKAVGVRQARELSATGNVIDASEALRIGLVNHVVPHADLLSFCQTLAEQIAATPAVSEVLALYDRGLDLDLNAALALEASHTSRRRLDAAAFEAAGRSTAERNRRPTDSG